MITVFFHSITEFEPTVTDTFEGTITELIIDLTTDPEWPCDFYSSTTDNLTFRRINTDDLITFSTK
jgi:hypothetical protein